MLLKQTLDINLQRRFPNIFSTPTKYRITHDSATPTAWKAWKWEEHHLACSTIRRTLTNDACHALVRALVLSRLDYCNGLLAKAPDYLLAQLSGVMRAAARLILQLPRKSHVSDAIRRQLHWLDISERVRFKLCVLARRCIHGSAPSYLSKYCIPVSSIAGRSHLRSAHLEICSFQRRTL